VHRTLNSSEQTKISEGWGQCFHPSHFQVFEI
jgi:hypothetical protein